MFKPYRPNVTTALKLKLWIFAHSTWLLAALVGLRAGETYWNVGINLFCRATNTFLWEPIIVYSSISFLWISLVPGSCAWAEKNEPGTHCLHMLSSPRTSGGNFRKICSVTLTSARNADFSCMKDACHWPRSVWTMTKEWRRHSALY